MVYAPRNKGVTKQCKIIPKNNSLIRSEFILWLYRSGFAQNLIKINLVDQYKINREIVANGYTKGILAPNSKVKHMMVAATAYTN